MELIIKTLKWAYSDTFKMLAFLGVATLVIWAGIIFVEYPWQVIIGGITLFTLFVLFLFFSEYK